MTAEQSRFFLLLSNYPRLAPCWDAGSRSMVVMKPRGLSAGEATVFRCLASIWLGEGHAVPFADLAALDPASRKPLVEWLANPFFP